MASTANLSNESHDASGLQSSLHIASSLLLLPYGLLCVYGIKAKLDPYVSETELVEEERCTFVAWGSIDFWFSCNTARLLPFLEEKRLG
jgi:hypothetical protein